MCSGELHQLEKKGRAIFVSKNLYLTIITEKIKQFV